MLLTACAVTGEHAAADQLPYGLLAALAGSGIREAARVLKALKSAGCGGITSTGSTTASSAATALEVGDEPPLHTLVTAAEAKAKSAAIFARSKTANGASGGGGTSSKGNMAQQAAKGPSAQVRLEGDWRPTG